MDEITRALQHRWTWRATDDEGIARARGSRAVELRGGDGCRYHKVTCAGVPVAYIRSDARGRQEYLLPPSPGPGWVG